MSSFRVQEYQLINDFNPRWWAVNGHLHTIVASQLSKVDVVNSERIRIPTPDDDFLEADLNMVSESGPIVTLFHGLEGHSRRYYIRNLMKDLERLGISSAALNFRGCGDEMNRQPIFYHSGATYDYKTFLSYLTQHYPDRGLYAVGFSLGANALIKYLGEEGSASLITRAAAVSPPFDLREGSLQLQQGFNHLYEIYFLRSLVEKLKEKKTRFPGLPDFSGNTLYDFDDTVTAPLHGFDDADHYYRTCSSRNFYGDVQVPTLIIHSKDDTLCPAAYAPVSVIRENSSTGLLLTDTGGHMGFLSSPPGWLNRTLLKWLGFIPKETS